VNVLLIEDNAGDARLFCEMLSEQISYTVELTLTTTMSEAEKHLGLHSVDVTVLDLGLPDAEGVGAVRRACAAAPNVPLVVLTGSDNESLAMEAIHEGAQDYLVKGQIESREFLRALRYAIERKVTEVRMTDDIVRLKRAEHERDAYEQQLEKSNTDLALLTVDLGQARDNAERATRAKSRFLAAMSHELRTPLHGILGYVQLMRMEGDLSDVQFARVEAMLRTGNHLLEMIQGVLDLSEIETEGFELKLADINLRRVGAACLDLVKPMAEAKGLTIGLSIESAVPHEARTDPARLRQVLLNLLGNAVKFTFQGSVSLFIRAMLDGTSLRFEVRDTGPGVLPEQQHLLFQRFARLDSSAAATVEGAGLGLSLSAQLAVLLGGRVGHHDNPTGGSVFWLELPLLPSTNVTVLPAGELISDLTLAQPAPFPLRGLKVLIVDDVAINRDIAASFIRAAGHEPVCAENGVEALTAAAVGDFDIVLMDVRMPIMDGLEATRRIRALKGTRGRVPIVAMTAQVFTEQVWECRTAGMDCHVAKPFTLDSLLAALAQGYQTGRRHAGSSGQSEPPVPPKLHEPIALANGAPTRALAMAVLDLEDLIFDEVMFNATTEFLTPEEVTSHMHTLAVRGGALLQNLRALDGAIAAGGELAEATHALAGSAGMFGFKRLASEGLCFERAIQTSAQVTPAATESLIKTLEITLQEMRAGPTRGPVRLAEPTDGAII